MPYLDQSTRHCLFKNITRSHCTVHGQMHTPTAL